MGPYVDAVCADITSSAPKFTDYEVVSIFFGGGTPTLLSTVDFEIMLGAISQNYLLAKDVSVTTESNPETVDFAYLAQLRKMGFNRISFGVQSFDDRLLTAIGRMHTAAKAVEAVNLAAEAGFGDINVDLMYALPHQSIADFVSTLEIAAKLPITHISCYALTVEDGTPLTGEQSSPLRDAMPGDDVDRQMYHMAREMLAAQGFEHYEISNWARPGYACRHNVGYWTHRQYIGFGVGAHGFVKNRRICRTDDLEAYIGRNFTGHILEELDNAAEMAEFMMLGLRMVGGIDAMEFEKRFGCNIYDIFGEQLKGFVAQGLLYTDGGKIALTPQGIDLSNTVFAEFL